MDALVSELSGGLLVNAEPKDSAAGPRSAPDDSSDTGTDVRADPDADTGHRLALYKNADRLSVSQDARRRDLLQRQKRSVPAEQCLTRECPAWFCIGGFLWLELV